MDSVEGIIDGLEVCIVFEDAVGCVGVEHYVAFVIMQIRLPDYPAHCVQQNCLLGGKMAGGNLILCIYRQIASTNVFL